MLIIRKAQQDDRSSIGNVHAAAVAGISTPLYTPEELQAWAIPKTPEDYETLISEREFYVAEENGLISGFGVLNKDIGLIEAVYVRPNVGRRGVGLELISALEETAIAHGLKCLRLNASLNAVPFYEKAGYVASERSTYRLSTGVEIACVPMQKEL